MKNINNVLKTPKLNLAASSLQAPQLLITGGRAPKADWLNQLCDMNNFVKIIAADHGIDSCQNANLTPDLLIGDGIVPAPVPGNGLPSSMFPPKNIPVPKTIPTRS